MLVPKLGIFCKSFWEDLGWLSYSLQLLEKFWRGPDPEVVVMLDKRCEPITRQWALRWAKYLYVEPWADGYSHAMAMKACADQHLPDCDLILLLDSDTMLTQPCALDDLLDGGRPVLEFRRWNDKDPVLASSQRKWRAVVLRSTGLELAADFMVGSAPRLFWRTTFDLVRDTVEKHFQKPFLEAIRSEAPYAWRQFHDHPTSFCENQLLGIMAVLVEPAKYSIRNPDNGQWFNSPFKQHWSHDPLPEEALKKLLVQSL